MQPSYVMIEQALFGDPAGKKLVLEWMRGRIRMNELVAFVARKTNIPASIIEHGLRHSARTMSFIDPAVIDSIQTLRQNGIKVVIATDNMDIFRQETVPALKLDRLFDDILTSDSLGALKNDIHQVEGTSLFFKGYLERHGIQPGQSVLIDDSADSAIVEAFGITFLPVSDNISLTHHLQDIIRSI